MAANPSTSRPPHLHAVDLMRVVTVLGVIGVHAVASTTRPASVTGGAAMVLLHVNREVFFVLTALVLTHSYASRPLRLGRFYARRYWLVATPYVAWTAVYLLADGLPASLPAALTRLGTDLVTGDARYHLYFLLVTMQIYLVFPLLLRLLQAARGHHVSLLAASLVVQLAFSAGIHYRVPAPGLLGVWLARPAALLPSYQFFVLLGAVAALHLERLAGWVRRRPSFVALTGAAAVAVGLASYGADLLLRRAPVAHASEVFQPAIAVESVGVALALFALGTRWAAWRRPGWLDRVVRDAAESSFGIYLAHPLLLQGAVAAAGAAGLLQIVLAAPGAVGVGVALAAVAPVGAATWALTWLMRRTPVSVALTGRRRSRHPAQLTRVPPVAVTGAGTGAVASAEATTSAIRSWPSSLGWNQSARPYDVDRPAGPWSPKSAKTPDSGTKTPPTRAQSSLTTSSYDRAGTPARSAAPGAAQVPRQTRRAFGDSARRRSSSSP
ncbi:MAG TPA: acyltransferase [Candidatus Dormibacteraeota bacterium]|nr:acyltransferase [Candidatus Dormibacteraeota bacterium]